MISYFGDSPPSTGVMPVIEQSTDEAARQAVTPQAPGSEEHPPENPDFKALASRLNELDKESTSLCSKLWAEATPTWMERDEINEKLSKVDAERYAIQAQLSELY